MSGFEKRVYLTGFMGSGKSTVGPILANVLGYAFIDLDEVIAAQAGKPIPRIFAEEGEASFRALACSIEAVVGPMSLDQARGAAMGVCPASHFACSRYDTRTAAHTATHGATSYTLSRTTRDNQIRRGSTCSDSPCRGWSEHHVQQNVIVQ